MDNFIDNLNISIKSKRVKKLVNIHLIISFFICALGITILWIYNTYYISKLLFKASIVIFRTGLFVGVVSIIYGIFFENYLKCN